MNIATALRRKDAAIVQLRDAYSAARICGQSHADLIARVRVIQDTTLKGAPRWALSEFKGYNRALSDRLYETSLVFGGYVNGVFCSTHRDRPDYYQTQGVEPAAFADGGLVKARGHYWSTTKTPKPFFVSNVKE